MYKLFYVKSVGTDKPIQQQSNCKIKIYTVHMLLTQFWKNLLSTCEDLDKMDQEWQLVTFPKDAKIIDCQ